MAEFGTAEAPGPDQAPLTRADVERIFEELIARKEALATASFSEEVDSFSPGFSAELRLRLQARRSTDPKPADLAP